MTDAQYDAIIHELRSLVNSDRTTRPNTIFANMPLADTEYYFDLPAHTEQFSIKSGDGTAFRVSFTPDRVAGSERPFVTVHAGTDYAETGLDTTPNLLRVYVACSTAGKVIEGVSWAKVAKVAI